MPKTALILPTYNPGPSLEHMLEAVASQTVQPDRKLIIDSSPRPDDVGRVARLFGYEFSAIPQNEFDHGGTRQLGASLALDAEVLIYMTQDSRPANQAAFERLLECFEDGQIGAAYARQLPSSGARPIGAHARLFNYPAEGYVRSLGDRASFGIKTVFFSNSFGAYRRAALADAGGFPSGMVTAEDMYVVARMLQKGWKVAYRAEAECLHSHDYGFIEEFRRYFDMGVFQSHQAWIHQTFGGAEGEGFRFVRSEIRYLLKHNLLFIPSAVLRTFIKFAAYKLGTYERWLPTGFKLFATRNRAFWLRDT